MEAACHIADRVMHGRGRGGVTNSYSCTMEHENTTSFLLNENQARSLPHPSWKQFCSHLGVSYNTRMSSRASISYALVKRGIKTTEIFSISDNIKHVLKTPNEAGCTYIGCGNLKSLRVSI